MSEAVRQANNETNTSDFRDESPSPSRSTPAPSKPPMSNKTPLIDRAERGGNIGRLLVVGLLLLGLVGLFTILPESMAKQVTLALLAFLSMIGVFFLFMMLFPLPFEER